MKSMAIPHEIYGHTIRNPVNSNLWLYEIGQREKKTEQNWTDNDRLDQYLMLPFNIHAWEAVNNILHQTEL